MCLGSVDLRELGQMYFYDIDVRIIRFLLLSHAGPMLRAGDEEAKAHAIGLAVAKCAAGP